MDSPATNVASSEKPGRWFQALHLEKLPLVVALGGVGLSALTFLLFISPRVLDDHDPAAVAFVMKSQSVAKDLDSGFRHDLLPERIQLPQFPDPDELRRDSRQDQQEIQSLGFSLSNLKVENVTYHKPITTEVALA
ncbi:unnamed protein product, partial [marine sediment metagenome]